MNYKHQEELERLGYVLSLNYVEYEFVFPLLSAVAASGYHLTMWNMNKTAGSAPTYAAALSINYVEYEFAWDKWNTPLLGFSNNHHYVICSS